MKCKFCNEELPERGVFCPICGMDQRKMLMEEGFPGNKLVTKAFGESVPVVADPKSEDEFQLNRRVEVRILPRVSASAQDTVRTSRDEAEKQMPADYKIDDTKASK